MTAKITTKDRILSVLQPGVVMETTELARTIHEDPRIVYASARNLALEGVLQKSAQRKASPGGSKSVRWRRKPQ